MMVPSDPKIPLTLDQFNVSQHDNFALLYNLIVALTPIVNGTVIEMDSPPRISKGAKTPRIQP